MTSVHVALLRGIAPANPATRNDRLRAAFTAMGFSAVRTVISSGNVVFETQGDPDAAELEDLAEQGLADHLGVSVGVIVRSRERLRALVDRDPFGGVAHEPGAVLNVTFLKRAPAVELDHPHRPEGKTYTLVALHDLAICSVVPSGGPGTSDLMTWLDRRFGKQVTTRTYRTVNRILQVMDAGAPPP